MIPQLGCVFNNNACIEPLNICMNVFGFLGSSDGKESAYNVGDFGLITELGRSPGGGHGDPFQYSCLENLHGQRVLVGYSPWGHKESDTTEQLSTHMHAPRSDTGAPYSQMCRSLLTCPAGITASRLTLLLLPLGLSPRDQQSKQSRP